MCGIGALLDPSDATPEDAPRRMVEALRHRGPDGEAVRRVGAATLVHTRLAIIDVAGGDQPLGSEDGAVWAIVNGEIYNHRALRRELERRGHRFSTRSDSEVVVHAYEEHGPNCARQLNGIFAFALWDERERRLVAARDPFGVKPLYWWSDGRRLALASEVGALLDAGLVTPEVDRLALDHYLACRMVPAPRTLFAGVRKLPPASLLIAPDEGPPRVLTYREPPAETIADPQPGELAHELAERFTDAVERQMMSDVPYGAFLSGGVDSAAVVAAMARRSEQPPATFTIGFPGHGSTLDEREYAAASARAIGARHRDTAMAETDYLAELARCIPRLEEPCGIPSAPALLQLSRFASGSVKVVLAGQGADEPHGGYGRHQAAAVLRHLARVPSPLARPLQAEASAERLHLAEGILGDVAGRDLLDQALYLDARMFLPDGILICNDKLSMAAGLELRVPFLDLELMRFVERIPARLRVRPGGGKALHRRAMRELLPREITERPKHGFATPYDRWLRESLGEEVNRRYARGSALAELIDPAAVSLLIAQHRRRRGPP